MSTVAKNIVKSYSSLFEGLDAITKLELIETLSKSLKKEKSSKDDLFFGAFGSFTSNESAEDTIKAIRDSRKFGTRDITF